MPVTQLLLYFSGINDSREGRELGPGDDDVSQMIRDGATAPEGTETKWFGRIGALSASARATVASQAVAFIKANADPAGSIIIYGYSAGGVNALETCRKLSNESASTTVDLLITVDAAARGETSTLDRTVPGNVLRNINFFQKIPQPSGSRGGPAVALSGTTTVENRQKGFMESGHEKIRTDTAPDVLLAIKGELRKHRPDSGGAKVLETTSGATKKVWQ